METKHNETATAHEWDEMRAQWAVLNRKLSNEPLVDDRHIRESMGKNLAWSKRMSKTQMASIPILTLFYLYLHFTGKISLALATYITVLFAFALLFEAVFYFTKLRTLYDGDLLTVARHIVQVKKIRRQAFFWQTPPTLVFFFWFVYEVIGVKGELIIPTWFFFVLCLIGSFLIGRDLYQRQNWMDDDILRQIKELTEGETSQHASTDNL